MRIRSIEAKSLLRKKKRIDSWFLHRYGLNLYRGCAHACAYCDGRAERYRVEGDFEKDIAVKHGAPALLARELDPGRRRTPWRPGFVLLGGGVSDCYQPAEVKERITRAVLTELAERGHPVHVLSKSPLLLRDLDLLRRIDQKSRAIVSVSFSTVDESVARRFEPHVATPARRLEVLAEAKAAGLATGLFLMPVIPGVSDSAEAIEASVAAAAEVGVDFLLFSGMTLKPGRQREHYLTVLEEHDPALVAPTASLYGPSEWGHARGAYYARIEGRFRDAARRHKLPARMPPRLYWGQLDDNDRVTVVLEHLAYLCRLSGRPAAYERAARSVAALKEPIAEHRGSVRRLPGVGAVSERIILDLLTQGRSQYYEKMLAWEA